MLGLSRTTLIEGTPKLCGSSVAPGFAMIGASGAPDRQNKNLHISVTQSLSTTAVWGLDCPRKTALVAENHDAYQDE